MDNNTILEKLFDKVESVDKRLDNVDVTLAKQNEQLTEHIRRTAIAEENIKHINKHVSFVEGGLKAIGVLSMILGLLKLIGLF